MQDKAELVPVLIKDQEDLWARADKVAVEVMQAITQESYNRTGTYITQQNDLKLGLQAVSRLMALAQRPDVSLLTRRNPPLPDTISMGKRIALAVETYPELFAECMVKLPTALNSDLFKPAKPPVGM